MTSTKAAAAIVIVAVLVVAVGAYALLNQGGGNGGGDTDAPVATIGTTVEVGDEYTLSSIYSSTGATLGADTTEQTKYAVTGKDGENLTVQVESNGQTSVDSMTQDDFLDDVSVVSESLIGTYDRNETISTNMGTIDCMIYKDQQSVGNTTTVTTYDWIGIGTNIIYKTQIEVSTAASTETYTTTLYSTNMIGQGGSAGAFIPDTPSTSGSIRTDLEIGDYIEFSKRDDDGRDYERITIVDIDGDRVVYREHDDDDRETPPCSVTRAATSTSWTPGTATSSTPTGRTRSAYGSTRVPTSSTRSRSRRTPTMTTGMIGTTGMTTTSPTI